MLVKGGDEEFRIPVSKFQDKAVLLLSKLKENTSAAFSIPGIENFINSFNCFTLKAKSSIKSDIRIIIHDQRTGTTPGLGFSIKSQLGEASTLLNAGKTTNFIYRIENIILSMDQIEKINNIDSRSKIKDRIEKIKELSGSLTFMKTENITFENNLTLIDSALPKIIAEVIYLYYTSGNSRIIDLINEISRLNPLGFNLKSNHPYYSYKMKHFLTDIALGMMPSKVWTGELDATGGYLVVKDDGEILCYHIYDRNEFEDYLLNNTKLETASSTRHDFGKIYEEEGDYYFKLNLQVRFLK